MPVRAWGFKSPSAHEMDPGVRRSAGTGIFAFGLLRSAYAVQAVATMSGNKAASSTFVMLR